MPIEKLSFDVARDHAGLRLDQCLARASREQTGRELSRRRARRLISAGAVYVDRRRVRVASRPVRPGARVEVYLDPRAEEGGGGPAAETDNLRVLFEDDHLLALDKPSGLPAQATVSDAVGNLYHLARAHLADRSGGEPYLALHHRLDRGTSGVMLFAKSRRANAGLAAAFAERRVRKLYRALVAVPAGRPTPESWSVSLALARRRPASGGRLRTFADPAGLPAETALRTAERFAAAALLEAEPRSGRTHQIRVHLAAGGWPVLGDRLYGGDRLRAAAAAAPRLMLHASMLELEHPLDGRSLHIESPLPEDFRRFAAALAGRR